MANFAPAVAEAEIAELPESVTLKVDKLVEHVRKSKHLVAFTGAGVSTSAGKKNEVTTHRCETALLTTNRYPGFQRASRCLDIAGSG